jgi:thymidylate synthase (FAD)
MGKIIVQSETTINPISLAGLESGLCWGSDTTDKEKNYKRGLSCIKDGHWRTLEYPQIYLEIDGYSAKCLRELYTHIAGGPTRLQASTRYIDYAKNGFDFVTPPAIAKDKEAYVEYIQAMHHINSEIRTLIDNYNIPKEDANMLLPLGMTSKMILRTNARHLIEMSRQRCCNRAYWEFRDLMRDIKEALSNYSEEWKELLNTQFGAKCDFLGYCPESKGCGKYPFKF